MGKHSALMGKKKREKNKGGEGITDSLRHIPVGYQEY